MVIDIAAQKIDPAHLRALRSVSFVDDGENAAPARAGSAAPSHLPPGAPSPERTTDHTIANMVNAIRAQIGDAITRNPNARPALEKQLGDLESYVSKGSVADILTMRFNLQAIIQDAAAGTQGQTNATLAEQQAAEQQRLIESIANNDKTIDDERARLHALGFMDEDKEKQLRALEEQERNCKAGSPEWKALELRKARINEQYGAEAEQWGAEHHDSTAVESGHKITKAAKDTERQLIPDRDIHRSFEKPADQQAASATSKDQAAVPDKQAAAATPAPNKITQTAENTPEGHGLSPFAVVSAAPQQGRGA